MKRTHVTKHCLHLAFYTTHTMSAVKLKVPIKATCAFCRFKKNHKLTAKQLDTKVKNMGLIHIIENY